MTRETGTGDRAESRPASEPRQADPRRPYRSPRLVCFGDIRDVTLGGSPGGQGDSGMINYYDIYYHVFSDYTGLP